MKRQIDATVRLVRPEGERSLSFEYDEKGYNISYPWICLPAEYRRELMFGVSNELLRSSEKLFAEYLGEIRPYSLS